jgi:NAD(P)H-flavin reductase
MPFGIDYPRRYLMIIYKNEETKIANPFLPEPARIVRSYYLTKDVKFYQVRIVDMEKAFAFKYLPGQFVMLSIPGIGEAPFSISSTPSRPGMLEFCIRKTGKLTEVLFQMKENSIIGIRGPYGNGFPVMDMMHKNLIIVAGGLGVAPLRSVLLYSLDNRDLYNNVTFLYGAREPADMIFRDEFLALSKREDLECYLAVEKDEASTWTEKIGLVTSLFKYIKEIAPLETYALVCGPPIMYKYVIAELLKYQIPKHQILMTLERRMKCGIGKCGHCAIDYIYTCIDGPVFTYWDVIYMRELI